MYYVLVNYAGSSDAVTNLLYGSLEDIKDEILNNDSFMIDDINSLMEEDEDCDYDTQSYDNLKDAKNPEDIKNCLNSYYLSDGESYTEVGGVVESYEELKELWLDYVADKEWLEDWRLPDKIDESDEVLYRIADEIIKVCQNYHPETKYLYIDEGEEDE